MIRQTQDGQWEVYHQQDVREAKGTAEYWYQARGLKQAEIDSVPTKRAAAHTAVDAEWDANLGKYQSELQTINDVIAQIEGAV